MSVTDHPYCSDCAWPYECSAKRACERRERGQIRSRSFGDRDPIMVTVTNPDGGGWVEDLFFETSPAWLKAGGRAR